MRAETYDSVDEVPDAIWDAVTPSDFFFTRAFTEVMERSGVEDARYRYAVLYEGDEPVGQATLSRFVVKLDLLTGDKWVKRARRLIPKMFELPVVSCGVPASLGQYNLHVVRPELQEAAIRCVHDTMEAWAQEERCTLLVWKEWSEDQGVREHLDALGYVAAPSLPDHALPDLPNTVEEYVGSMRSSYRRKYKEALALMEGDGPVWTSGKLRFEEGPFTVEVADEFYGGYMKLMDRAKVRLETYTPEFFRGLAESTLDTRALRLTNEENGESLLALMIAHGDVLAFALVAKDHADYEDALYAILLRTLALYAIKGGFREVRMGQTSSYSKMSMGAQPKRLEVYLKVRGKLRHKVIARFRSVLFPEEPTPDLSVFKDAEGAPAAEPVSAQP
jgi:hypothetical protein